MRAHPPTWLLSVLLVCLFGHAPAQADAANGIPGATALERRALFSDVVVANTFLALGLTPEQAVRLQTITTDLQVTLADLDQQLDAAQAAAWPTVTAQRDLLLEGREIPDTLLQPLNDYYGQAQTLALAREEALTQAYDAAVAVLTPAQRRLLEGLDAEAAAEIPEVPANLVRQRAGVFRAVALLLQQARETPDPGRFRANAPTAVADMVAALTGLAEGDPLFAELSGYLLDRVTFVYTLMPAQFALQGPTVAAQMTDAVVRVLYEMYAASFDRPANRGGLGQMFDEALRYPRVGPVLGYLANRGPTAADR